MAVYVDIPFTAISNEAQARRAGARHGHKWCHMWADTLEELHAMADKIGMKRAWFQNHRLLPHYDLVPTKRDAAIRHGAIEKDLREVFRARRSK